MSKTIKTTKMEIEALIAFRESIDNTFKEHMRSSIGLALGSMECVDQCAFSTAQKIDCLTELVTKSVKWRIEYERLAQFTKR